MALAVLKSDNFSWHHEERNERLSNEEFRDEVDGWKRTIFRCKY
jgi:hypothetical protein